MSDDIFQPFATLPGITGSSAFDVLRHYLEFTVFPLATSLYDSLKLKERNGINAMIFYAADENGPDGHPIPIDCNACTTRDRPKIRLWELTAKLSFRKDQPVSDLWAKAPSEFHGIRHPLHKKDNMGYPRPAFVDDTIRFASTLTAARISHDDTQRAVYSDAVLEIGKAVLYRPGPLACQPT